MYQAKVPGSLMLFGEHAVLHGALAIVCAVNRYLSVTLEPRSDSKVIINSELGNYEAELDALEVKEPLKFVLATINYYRKKLSCGFVLTISSDFSANLGLGSSAAVTVATVRVLNEWLKPLQKPHQTSPCQGRLKMCSPPDKGELEGVKIFKTARKIIQEVQGIASGADVAASCFGGIVAYKMEPLYIEKLPHRPPLTVVYSGAKEATSDVVTKVNSLRQRYPKIFATLYEAIDSCSKEALYAIKDQDWQRLGELMNIHQGLHDALGVNTLTLAELIFRLRSSSNIYGAKISGSGLGDCVVAVGKEAGIVQLDVEVAP